MAEIIYRTVDVDEDGNEEVIGVGVITRCRDCRHGFRESYCHGDEMLCNHPRGTQGDDPLDVHEDGYCAWAEPKVES